MLIHWLLAEMLHNDDNGRNTWRLSSLKRRWLSTRLGKHVARDTQTTTFESAIWQLYKKLEGVFATIEFQN